MKSIVVTTVLFTLLILLSFKVISLFLNKLIPIANKITKYIIPLITYHRLKSTLIFVTILDKNLSK